MIIFIDTETGSWKMQFLWRENKLIWIVQDMWLYVEQYNDKLEENTLKIKGCFFKEAM